MNRIFGNEKTRQRLQQLVNNNSIGHAYIFCGIDGIGKFEYAKEFAKNILCLNSNNGVACGACESCQKFLSSPDLLMVEPEDGLIKVEKIRYLIDSVMLKPTISNRSVFIIRDAEFMNESSQNALLKVLEEPPQYATIILTVQNQSRIINTIHSRCTKIDFSALSFEEIKNVLGRDDITKELYDYSRGSAGKLQKILDSSYTEIVKKLDEAIQKTDLLEMNQAIVEIKDNALLKEEIDIILDLLLTKLRLKLEINPLLYSNQMQIVEEARSNISRNANFDTALDYMMIKLWEQNKR